MKFILFCIALLLPLLAVNTFFETSSREAPHTIQPSKIKIDTVASGLNVPWEILWGPDNELWNKP
jgi:glucose/arabinose dehydrogenase